MELIKSSSPLAIRAAISDCTTFWTMMTHHVTPNFFGGRFGWLGEVWVQGKKKFVQSATWHFMLPLAPSLLTFCQPCHLLGPPMADCSDTWLCWMLVIVATPFGYMHIFGMVGLHSAQLCHDLGSGMCSDALSRPSNVLFSMFLLNIVITATRHWPHLPTH